MQCEADEKESESGDDEDGLAWDFIRDGLSDSDHCHCNDAQPMPDLPNGEERGLAAAKRWREKLKTELFEAKERTRVRRQQAHRLLYIGSSESE